MSDVSTNPLRHFRRSGADWNLFLRAYAWVLLIRLALWVRPFSKIYAWATKVRTGQPGDCPLDRKAVYKVVWAISAAARRVPKATCLTQALATQIMLGRRGHRTVLQFGIQKRDGGKFDAHAWIERDGEVLIGFNDNFNELTRLPTLEQEMPKKWARGD